MNAYVTLGKQLHFLEKLRIGGLSYSTVGLALPFMPG